MPNIPVFPVLPISLDYTYFTGLVNASFQNITNMAKIREILTNKEDKKT